MKLTDKISWLMGRVQKSLLPHLDECFEIPPTEQEKRLVSILEIVHVEKYVSNRTTYQWRCRKPLDRQSLARAFVAKALYRIPTTSDLIRALQATKNLRRSRGVWGRNGLVQTSHSVKNSPSLIVLRLSKQGQFQQYQCLVF